LWGSKFTTKAFTLQGGQGKFLPSLKFVPSPWVVALGPVFARARVLVHVVVQADKFAERQRKHSTDYAGIEVKEPRAGHILPPEASW
jgi:hypothetical protein